MDAFNPLDRARKENKVKSGTIRSIPLAATIYNYNIIFLKFEIAKDKPLKDFAFSVVFLIIVTAFLITAISRWVLRTSNRTLYSEGYSRAFLKSSSINFRRGNITCYWIDFFWYVSLYLISIYISSYNYNIYSDYLIKRHLPISGHLLLILATISTKVTSIDSVKRVDKVYISW